MTNIRPIYTTERALEAGWHYKEATAFAAFMNAVNQRIVMATGGLTLDDFPAWHWADAFDCRDSVDDVAIMFLSDMWENEL